MEESAKVLLDYGVLGVVCTLFATCIVYLYRASRAERKEMLGMWDEMDRRYRSELDHWHVSYKEERSNMLTAMHSDREASNKELRELSAAIREQSKVFTSLQQFLRENTCKFEKS